MNILLHKKWKNTGHKILVWIFLDSAEIYMKYLLHNGYLTISGYLMISGGIKVYNLLEVVYQKLQKILSSRLCNFIKIIIRHESSPLNLMHVFSARFCKNTSGGLLR